PVAGSTPEHLSGGPGAYLPPETDKPPASSALARATALEDSALRAQGCANAAARACIEESAQVFRELGDRTGLAYSLALLGCLRAGTGEGYEEARRAGAESLAIFREQGSRTGTSYALLALGRVAYQHGQPAA